MTTATSTAQQTIQLNCLTDDQLQTIFALYGQEGLNRYGELATSRQELEQALSQFIEQDNNKDQQNKLTSLIAKYSVSLEKDKDKLAELEKEAQEAVKAKNGHKKAVNGFIATFTLEIEGILPESNKNLLREAQEKAAIAEALAYRDNLRKKGKREYLKAIVASVIDNCEKEYIEEVKNAVEVNIKVAQALIKETDNPTTLKGTKEIIRLAFPRPKKSKAHPTNDAARAGANLENGSKINPPVKR